MLVIREIMYCKPGKVRPLVEKFVAMNKLGVTIGMPNMRIMTDFAAERYWTVVSEMEVAALATFEKMMSEPPKGSAEDMKQFEELMKGYHDLVDQGKREIYKREGCWPTLAVAATMQNGPGNFAGAARNSG
ncbi:MAG: hypothetical protein M3Y05_00705 [Gemmatimonadota bacterium]|nr:hypothetical protein [Gemmatimonadota bacterium]